MSDQFDPTKESSLSGDAVHINRLILPHGVGAKIVGSVCRIRVEADSNSIPLQVVEALDTIARLHDHEKSTPELAQNMYSARCIALQALRVIKGERG